MKIPRISSFISMIGSLWGSNPAVTPPVQVTRPLRDSFVMPTPTLDRMTPRYSPTFSLFECRANACLGAEAPQVTRNNGRRL